MEVNYGATLPDSEYLLNSKAEAIIGLFPTAASFIHLRVGLEREYSRALSLAASKSRLQAIKEASDRVGTGKSTNTLEEGWMKVLEAADLDAREHLALADALQSQVVDLLNSTGARLETVRKKQHAFAGRLSSERERAYDERNKAKQKYYDACEAVESARLKKSQAKDERQIEKATKVYDMAMEDMYITKNEFIIQTDVANCHKARLYNTDLPSLHDDFQLLEESTINQLVHLFKKFTAIQTRHLTRLNDNVGLVDRSIAGISVEEDQNLFIEAHSKSKLAAWEDPKDLVFEESAVWHDSDEMSITPSSIVYLQNVKIKCSTKLNEINPQVESKRREIAGLRNLREAYEKDRTLGDAGSVLENLFDSSRDTTLLEINQTELKAQVELINATLPEDQANSSLKLHVFKNSSFVTPISCVVCQSSVWGKGRSCRNCGCSVHAKCELKVPAGCGAGPSGIARVKTGTSIISPGNAGRRAPPAFTPAAPPKRGEPTSTPRESATMLYSYEAATAFELSITEGEVVSVVEPEDEAGWIKVSTKDGRVGLVPGSYLQVGGGAGGAASEEVGEQVVALYDYEAAGADELNLVEGERLTLSSVGMNAGDGWAEAIKDGRKGLVPSSYIQPA